MRQSDGTDTFNVDVAPAVANTATDGTYQLSNGPFGNANSGASYSSFQYGIATVGMGLTGFSGVALNGDDYGIFATGSSTSSGGLASARPLIDGSVKFWIAQPTLWTSLGQLGSSVRVTYGSLPDNFITATTTSNPTPPDTPPPTTDSDVVPEPASLLAWVGVLSIGGFVVRRRRTY